MNRIRLGCHKDTINIYRSCIAGNGFNIGARLESYAKHLIECENPDNKVITHTSNILYEEAVKYDKGIKNSSIIIRILYTKNWISIIIKC